MSAYISGYSASPETWQLLYGCVIGAAALFLFFALWWDLRRERPPAPIVILGILGGLTWFTPLGFIILLMIYLEMWLAAPIAASALATAFVIGAFWLASQIMVPEHCRFSARPH